jgi:hypothetical protein
MSADIAEKLGRAPAEGFRPPSDPQNSAMSALIEYLKGAGAKWLEQQELDPALPIWWSEPH